MLVPPAGKRAAAKIARDFAVFIEGVTEEYNKNHQTELSPAQALVELLNSGIEPEQLMDSFREDAEKMRSAINMKWGKEDGYEDGYKWMTPKFGKWFVYNALSQAYKIDDFTEYEGRPDLAKVLIEHPNGEKWMSEFVVQLRVLLYGK